MPQYWTAFALAESVHDKKPMYKKNWFPVDLFTTVKRYCRRFRLKVRNISNEMLMFHKY